MLPIHDKVAAGGSAGLIVTVLVSVLGLWHITLPAAAIAALVTLVTFVASYLKTETKLGHEIAKVAAPILDLIEQEGPVAKG